MTLLQFAENLSDRRAADAVRSQIDWKSLLALELLDPGLDASVLSEFRTCLVAGHAEALLFGTLLALCRDRGLLTRRGRQRTDATYVLGAVRSLNRLGCVLETLRAALNAPAVAAPDWLRGHAHPDWAERYMRRADDLDVPQAEAARLAFAESVGHDGHALPTAFTAPAWLHDVPAVAVLRRVWMQNFICSEAEGRSPGSGASSVRWRTAVEGLPPSLLMVASPVGRGDQTDRVAEGHQLPRPVMRTAAGLQGDGATRLSGEDAQDLRPRQPLAEHTAPCASAPWA